MKGTAEIESTSGWTLHAMRDDLQESLGKVGFGSPDTDEDRIAVVTFDVKWKSKHKPTVKDASPKGEG